MAKLIPVTLQVMDTEGNPKRGQLPKNILINPDHIIAINNKIVILNISLGENTQVLISDSEISKLTS